MLGTRCEGSREGLESAREPRRAIHENRTRNYAFILYQESVYEGWESALEGLHVPCAVSPLHDADKDADGNLKKPHWHVLLAFSGKKSASQVLKLLEPLELGVSYCEQVYDLRAYTRYLAHLDSRDKAKYDKDEIKAFSGFRLSSLIAPTDDEEEKMREDIIDFCRESCITEFCELINACADLHPEWSAIVCKRSFYFDRYLTSFRNSILSASRRKDF